MIVLRAERGFSPTPLNLGLSDVVPGHETGVTGFGENGTEVR